MSTSSENPTIYGPGGQQIFGPDGKHLLGPGGQEAAGIITITPTSLNLKDGETFKDVKADLVITRPYTGLKPRLSWSSSDTSVFTVDKDTGVITVAKKIAGKAKHTASLIASTLIDGIPVTKSIAVTVGGQKSSGSSSLSTGDVVGIAIGASVGFLLLVALIVWLVNRKDSSATKSVSPRKSASPYKSASPLKSASPYE